LIHKVVEIDVNEEEIKDYLPPAYEALCHLDKKEIIKRFIAAEFNHFLDYYRDAEDINAKSKPRRERQPGQQRSQNSKRNRKMEAYDTKRFSISVGRVHKVNAGAIVRLVCDTCNIKSNQIGAIDLGRDTSHFEVSKEAVGAIRNASSDMKLDGRKISIRAAGGGGKGGPKGGGGRQGGRGGRRRD
jgi:ATP-dependent RNA helicase DeaD